MEPEAKYTLVGSAVLLLLGLLAAAALWLHGTGEGSDDRQYKIYFERQSLEGLENRSEVKMKGIRVGAVTAFRISTWRPGAVEVLVRVEGNAPVRESTKAVVDRHLVTGVATIRLENKGEDSPLLRSAPQGENFPVIAEGESEMQQFSASVNQLAQRADETMRRLNAVLSDRNQSALAETLASLQRLSQSAERSLAGLDRALAGVERTLGSVAGAADGVKGMSAGIEKDAAAALRELTASVRKVSEDVARLSQRADGVLASSDEELRATAQALRAAADSLGAAGRRLGDPQRVLFGPHEGSLGPGEKAK